MVYWFYPIDFNMRGTAAMILDKKQMTEEDIKLNYITPAINRSGWVNGINITMETKITDGRINLRGNIEL